MKRLVNLKRLGFFTRLLDAAPPAERYRLAAEQIRHAEKCGLDSAWIAQHHFHEAEGGLPAPFAFLGYVAAQTSRIRLGTGIVTLPLEHPVRVAEDAAVLDLMANGRFELGVGTGGNPSAFAAFGLDSAQRSEIFAQNLEIVRNALAGGTLTGGDTLYPPRPQLCDRIWQATFSVSGGARAGQARGRMFSAARGRARLATDCCCRGHSPGAGKPRMPRLPRSSIPLSTPISTHCRRAANPGSWPRAAFSPLTIARLHCGWPISGCAGNSISSSQAVMRIPETNCPT